MSPPRNIINRSRQAARALSGRIRNRFAPLFDFARKGAALEARLIQVNENIRALAVGLAEGVETRQGHVARPEQQANGLHDSAPLTACPCTMAQLGSATFRKWCPVLKEEFKWHRKLWEYCFICQVLSDRGVLTPGKRGLRFGVGAGPLTAAFANAGCEIVATALPHRGPQAPGSSLNVNRICLISAESVLVLIPEAYNAV